MYLAVEEFATELHIRRVLVRYPHIGIRPIACSEAPLGYYGILCRLPAVTVHSTNGDEGEHIISDQFLADICYDTIRKEQPTTPFIHFDFAPMIPSAQFLDLEQLNEVTKLRVNPSCNHNNHHHIYIV